MPPPRVGDNQQSLAVGRGGRWHQAQVAVGWLPAAFALTCVFSSSGTPTQTWGWRGGRDTLSRGGGRRLGSPRGWQGQGRGQRAGNHQFGSLNRAARPLGGDSLCFGELPAPLKGHPALCPAHAANPPRSQSPGGFPSPPHSHQAAPLSPATGARRLEEPYPSYLSRLCFFPVFFFFSLRIGEELSQLRGGEVGTFRVGARSWGAAETPSPILMTHQPLAPHVPGHPPGCMNIAWDLFPGDRRESPAQGNPGARAAGSRCVPLPPRGLHGLQQETGLEQPIPPGGWERDTHLRSEPGFLFLLPRGRQRRKAEKLRTEKAGRQRS